VVTAVPCLLLLALGTGMAAGPAAAPLEHHSLVTDAMRAMPRFKAWVLRVSQP